MIAIGEEKEENPIDTTTKTSFSTSTTAAPRPSDIQSEYEEMARRKKDIFRLSAYEKKVKEIETEGDTAESVLKFINS